MNRIDERFARLAARNEAAFIPFFTAGDPAPEATLKLLERAEEAGADLIELGFPFSDPIADGPTIQASYTRALAQGQRVEDVLSMVERARGRCRLPIVAMVSYSIVFKLGFEAFIGRAMAAGIDGATIPDLPVEEAAQFMDQAERAGFHLICFATPATTEARRELVIRHAHGFIYYISVRGITGERDSLPPDLAGNIQALKSRTAVPVAVGFGVSTPPQAAAVARVADGVIVGSAIVSRMFRAHRTGADPGEAALEFIRHISAAVKAAR